MTHSHLLRVFTYLGLRGHRKIACSNSIAVFPSLVPALPQSRIQLVDAWSTLWQSHHYTTRNKGDSHYPLLILANQGACCRMGQASSFVRGYGGADENGSERSKEGIDKGSKGAETHEGSIDENDSAKVSNDVDATVEDQVVQKATADVLAKVVEAETILEDALTSELDKKLEKDMVSEGSNPAETENVKNIVAVLEDPVKAQTALNLALDELGEPPERPLPGDCCGQGCDVCVWDTYNDELRDYLVRKKALLKKSK